MNGYKIIDFKGENLNEGFVPGIWDKVRTATKPLVFSNFRLGDSDEIQKPFFAGFGLYKPVDAMTYGYEYIIANNSGMVATFTIKSNDEIEVGVYI